MPLHDTRGAASATGFGFGASTGSPDWSKYAMVPYNSTANAFPNRIAFLNVAVNTIDYDIALPTTSSGTCVMRMGNYLVVGRICTFWVINIRTGNTVQSQTTPFGSQQTGDFFKFAEDKFGILTKIGYDFQVITFQMNPNGTTTQIAYNQSVASWGAATGFDGPMGAAVVSCDSKGIFSSFSGFVAFRSIYSYISGNTTTVDGNFTVSADGTSIALYNAGTNSENFSRPSACSGGLNKSIIYDMDHSTYYITGGTTYGMSGYTASGAGTPTSFRGCGCVQSQIFLNMGFDGGTGGYIRKMTASGASTPLALSVSSGTFTGTMQMYGDGAFFAYNASSGTGVYQTYSTGANTFSGEFVLPTISSGCVNKNGNVYGTYNF